MSTVMTKRDLPTQIKAARLCLDMAREHGVTEGICDTAAQAIKSLEWMDANVELIREVARLNKQAPEVLQALKVFEGAKIVRIDGGEAA